MHLKVAAFFFQRKISHNCTTVTQKPYSNPQSTLSSIYPRNLHFIQQLEKKRNRYKTVLKICVISTYNSHQRLQLEKHQLLWLHKQELWPSVSAPTMNSWLHFCIRCCSYRSSDPSYVVSIDTLHVLKKRNNMDQKWEKQALSLSPEVHQTQIHPQVECDVQIYQVGMIVTPQIASQHEIYGSVPSYSPHIYARHHSGKIWGLSPKNSRVNWFPCTSKTDIRTLLLASSSVLSVCTMLKVFLFGGSGRCVIPGIWLTTPLTVSPRPPSAPAGCAGSAVWN